MRLSVAVGIAGVVVSLGCGLGGSEAPTPDGPADPIGAKTEPVAAAPVPAQPTPVQADPDELELFRRLPAERYADTWLVITQNTPEAGPVDPSLVALSESNPTQVAHDQLHSGHFKGLMPCWVTTIAGAAPDRSDAVAILDAVKAAGIDAYLKPSGAYVGPSAAVDAVCRELRAEVGECADGVRMAHVVNGHWQVPLVLPDAVAESAMAGAPSPTRATERGDAWTAPLVVETLGDVHVGDAMTVHPMGESEPQDCTVTGFASTTLGIPHFGMAGEPRPSCGTAAPFAVLDCAADDVSSGLAVSGESSVSTWQLGPAVAGESDADIVAQVRTLPAITAVYEAAVADAEAVGQPLQQTVQLRPGTQGAARIAVVELTWFTGEGFAGCGMDDAVHRVAIAVTEEGIPISPAVDLAFAEVAGVVRLPGDRQATIATSSWYGGVTVGASCALAIDYCDCPC